MNDLVLVTGGTGAIGAPLAETLSSQAPVAVLARHAAAGPAGVELLCGDITRDRLGLATPEWSSLRARTTTIVHAAALTRFDAPLAAARAVNVEGTRHVLEFAAECPRLERICALSTVHVAGRRTATILEHELTHDRGFVNSYERSKYDAEQLLREWMPRLPIAICRLSTALGDSRSGAVRRPAAIHQAVRFLYNSLLPMVPGAPDAPVDLIATDYAVAAIGHLSGAGFVAGRSFHVCAANEAIGEQALLDHVIECFLRHRPAWRRRAIAPPDIVPLPTFELFRESVEAVADSTLLASVRTLGHFAPQLAYPKVFDDTGCQAAVREAGIVRPPIQQTADAVVKYLIEHNWSAAARDDEQRAAS
jgi:nucleoside-diphosphate-sugar epimerase